ncbi:MAG TPA: hypothetical protein VEJ47_20355 [Candidatus Eremiobacteraceae bacterium]|nr:hypothetical protein [Candidatus Eremiobacteraceae bacterium]
MSTAFYTFLLSRHLRLYPPPPFLAQMIEASVRSNTEQPRLELGVSAKTRNSTEAPKKYFLRQVFRILPMSDHPVDECK